MIEDYDNPIDKESRISVPIKPLKYHIIENFMIFISIYPILIIISHNSSSFNRHIINGFILLILTSFIPMPKRMLEIRKNKFLSLIVYLGIIFIPLIIGTTILQKTIYMMVILGMLFNYLRKNKLEVNKYRESLFLIINESFLFIWFIVTIFVNSEIVRYLCSFNAFINAFLYSIYLYFTYMDEGKKNMLSSLSDELKNSYIKRTKSFRNKFYFYLCVATSLVWFISTFLGGIFEKLFGNKIASFIFGFLNSSGSSSASKNDIEKMGLSMGNKSFKNTKNLYKHISRHHGNSIIPIIFDAILILIAIFVILLIVKAIRRMLNDKTYRYKSEEEVESVFSFDDIKKDFSSKIGNIPSKIKSMINLSNEEKVRKLYKKLVLNQKSEKFAPDNFKTPNEISSEAQNSLNIDLGEVTKIYERARYGNDICSKDDVESIRNFKL